MTTINAPIKTSLRFAGRNTTISIPFEFRVSDCSVGMLNVKKKLLEQTTQLYLFPRACSCTATGEHGESEAGPSADYRARADSAPLPPCWRGALSSNTRHVARIPAQP